MLFLASVGTTVRKKKIQQALQALKEGFQTAGTPIEEATIDLATEIATTARFQRLLTTRPDQLAIVSVLAATLYQAGKNEDPEEKWRQSLERLKSELPYMLRSGFQSGIKDVIKDLPKKPGSGRHRLLKTPSERNRACDLVSKYVREGESFRTAYEKVAAEMNCSPRTVQRAWGQRPRKRKLNQGTPSPSL